MHHGRFTCFNFLKFLIKKYYYYLIIGVIITLVQIFWGYYILYIGIENSDTSVIDRTGKKPVFDSSESIYPSITKRKSPKALKDYAEYLVQTYSGNYANNEDCIINGKDALSALKRAKSEDCKSKIRSLACKTEEGNFYAKRLTNSCPSKGNVKGRLLGCYTDNIDDRVLKGFKTQLVNNHPNVCVDICLQRGYIYAGVEYSKECFCGNHDTPVQLRVPEERCNMKCSGNKTEATCGGYWAIEIRNTGLANVVPNATLPWSNASGPEVRIAFILTVNGRSLRQIQRLIKALYAKQHFFYIHVDSRQHYLFAELLKLEESFSNIVLSRNRLSSIWGGASLLTVLLNSMKELFQKSEWYWDFVLNLSESDYPIKKVTDLTKFLSANRNRNFLKSHGQNTNSFLKKQGLDRTFFECEKHMWRIGERKLPFGIRMDGGSDWLCLGRQFVEYVVFSQGRLVVELKKLFSFTLLPAESFFHTVLRNSELCHSFTDNNLHLTNWNRKLGCRCQYKDIVDWCGCSPNDFVKTDFPKIQASGKRNLFFGRKFEPVKSLTIINKLDEYIHGKNQPGTPGLESHWENRYHIIDHPSGRTDADLTLYRSGAQLGINSIRNCDASLLHITEVHTLHQNDSYEGIIIKYVAKFGSNNITMEAHITKESQFSKHNNHPIATSLKDFQINSNFDLKEQMFRNFEEALGSHSQLVAVFWWQDVDSMSERPKTPFNISLILVDPLGVIASNDVISIATEKQINHQLSFSKPIRPGLWWAFVILEDIILARNTFTILCPQFLNGRRISEREERELNDAYIYSYDVKRKDFKEIIFSEDSQNLGYFDKLLLEQKTSTFACDSLVERVYALKDICFVDDKKLPPCIKNASKCANLHWSSLSPDPKSTLV